MKGDNLFVCHIEISQTTKFIMCLWYHFKAFNEYGYIISAIVIVVLYMDIQMAVFPIFPRYKNFFLKKKLLK